MREQFQGIVFTVGRLVRIEKTVRRKVISYSGFDDMFNDSGYVRKVINQTKREIG